MLFKLAVNKDRLWPFWDTYYAL